MNPTRTTNLLVIAEHDQGQLKLATLAAVACARQVSQANGGAFEILVLGEQVDELVKVLSTYGAANVLKADHALLKHSLADKYAYVIASVAKERGSTMIVGAASTFSKDILPRVSALVDAGMLSDVTSVTVDGDDFTFERVMFAGNVIATVKLDGPLKVFTVRAAAFAAPRRSNRHPQSSKSHWISHRYRILSNSSLGKKSLQGDRMPPRRGSSFLVVAL